MGKFTFGKAGVSYECDKVDLKVHEGAPRCPRCQDRVYFNEERKALGKTWHTRCFTCCQCKKGLSSTNYNEFNGELMCPPCHRRQSPMAAGSVTPTGSVSAAVGGVQRPGFAAAMRHRGSLGDELEIAQGVAGLQMGRSASSGSIVNRDDPECCPLCGKRVYFAEELKAMKRKWHKLCFKCVTCKKTLEPGRFTEHDSLLYCQTCYGKQFGPRGYGYSGGLGSLLSTDPVAFHHHYTNGSSLGDTYSPLNGSEVHEYEPIEPIRGTQEWTESVFVERT